MQTLAEVSGIALDFKNVCLKKSFSKLNYLQACQHIFSPSVHESSANMLKKLLKALKCFAFIAILKKKSFSKPK